MLQQSQTESAAKGLPGTHPSRARAHWAGRLLMAFACGLTGAFSLPAVSAAQSADDAVIQVVVEFFDAMRARDEAGLQSLFLEGARLSGPTTDDAGEVTVRDVPIDRFIGGVMGAPEGLLLDERIYDPEVRIDGDLATVWVAYDFYAGDEFSHCGYDAFQLANTADGWRIFQIADTRRSEGCPER